MRFFRHGDKGEVLAIVIPPSLQRSSSVVENEDFEFIEVTPGAFLLVRKQLAEKIISDNLLGKLGGKLIEATVAEAPKHPVVVVHQPTTQKPAPSTPAPTHADPLAALDAQGYLIADEESAKAISAKLEPQIKSKLVLGVRGFDKRYYIVNKSYYDAMSARITASGIGGEFSAETAGNIAKTNADAANAVLQVMKEEGNVIEKKKGSYQLV